MFNTTLSEPLNITFSISFSLLNLPPNASGIRQAVAECEACASRGDLSGCFACDGRGWRQLTEDEEHELSEMQG